MKQSAKKQTAKEPYWSPLPRPQLSLWQQAGIVLRHVIPAICTFWFGWSLGQFALLSVFNIAFSMTSIALVGLGASILTMKSESPMPLLDKAGAWASLLACVAILTGVLTALFGWIVIVMSPEGMQLLTDRNLWTCALSMVLAAAPNAVSQIRADAQSGLSEEQRKQRDQPRAGVLFFSGIIVFAVSGFAADWFGAYGLYPLLIAITALFIFSDLRPDLMRELIRSK